MTYILQPNTPKATANGTTVTAGLCEFAAPGGMACTISIFANVGSEWTIPGGEYGFIYWDGKEEMFAAMQAAGGSVKYWKLVLDRLNALFAKYFPAVTPPLPTEPKTPEKAVSWINSMFAASNITVVNGAPSLK